ncbi:MAG TPA: TIGR03013 family XrtA/PEP-CTERM system glycosyltransferase [Candidatus Polarisedimenticolaceae bacterium]|nr:TIGR03013 family XrtA/PEP-CTERM system glycosyltransferase [Candidatus Polarisedimenticolaceae bacterium]
MAPFRLLRPRLLGYLALEGSLIFAVLYGLAALSVTLHWETGPLALHRSVASAGTLFLALLLFTQAGRFREQSTVLRELVVFGFVSLCLGWTTFGVLWLYHHGEVRLAGLLAAEGAIAVPLTVTACRWITGRLEAVPAFRERLLIVGTGETARQVCRWITGGHAGEYGVLGFADEDETRLGTVLAMGARIQTDYAGLTRFCERRVDRVIVALDEKRGKLPVLKLMELRLCGIEIEEATSFIERVSGKISVETMLPSWLIYSEGFKNTPLRSAIKRASDMMLSSVLLGLASPLMLLTAGLIRLDSRGPALYRQKRVGRNGVEFAVLKFRSMRADAERSTGPTWAQANDPRVTRVGRAIRKLRIDELPQLINVLRGEMSFVGPRPERAHFVQQLERRIPYYALRKTARPGITGWAQVEYRYGASEQDALEKLKYDLYYIKNCNPLFDLWIVMKTVKVVLLGSGAR